MFGVNILKSQSNIKHADKDLSVLSHMLTTHSV